VSLPEWEILDGSGLVALGQSAALLVDLDSIKDVDDLVDLLNAVASQEPREAVELVMQRLPALRAGLAVQHGPNWAAIGTSGVHIYVAGAWRDLDTPVDVDGGFGISLTPNGGSLRSWASDGSHVVRTGSGFALALDSATWWSGWGDRPTADPEQHGSGGVAGETRAPDVQGVLCRNGHLNNPASLTCMSDGLSLIGDTMRLVSGIRPVFASLVLDGGETVPLARSVVAGRSPETHPDVRSGDHDALVLDDASEWMSRAHFMVSLTGWTATVSDIGSLHGTYVQSDGSLEWTRLTSDTHRELRGGDRIRAGGRIVRFERHDGAT
jgi:hypothetical protein